MTTDTFAQELAATDPAKARESLRAQISDWLAEIDATIANRLPELSFAWVAYSRPVQMPLILDANDNLRFGHWSGTHEVSRTEAHRIAARWNAARARSGDGMTVEAMTLHEMLVIERENIAGLLKSLG